MSVCNTRYGADKIEQMLVNCRSIFFIGIGGITMSSLSHISHIHGYAVGGSDKTRSPITERLEKEGIEIFYCHDAAHIEKYDAVVYTVAVRDDNPELVRAKERKIPVISRADYLGYIMKKYECRIGVSGMHGKSTTTSMISGIFCDCGKNPTIVSGAELGTLGGAYRVGGGEYFIFESCEYMNSYHSFYPTIAVVLNAELDHVDFFPDLDAVKKSFREYLLRLPEDGVAVINADDENLRCICDNLDRKVFCFGAERNADLKIENIKFSSGGSCFDLVYGGKRARVTLSVPGMHNVYDAAAAVSAAVCAGLSIYDAAGALADFSGAKRRMERRGFIGKIPVYDDYAHHPTEISATLNAARDMGYDRVVCVFQPHTFSRTAGLFDGYVKSLSIADKLILADIYAARETDTLGVSSKKLADAISAAGRGSAMYFDSFEKIVACLNSELKDGDMLIVMGAGDINKIIDMLPVSDK